MKRYNELDVAGFLRKTQAVENGHEIWNLQCQGSVQDMFVESGRKRINKIKIIFVGDYYYYLFKLKIGFYPVAVVLQ
jgi:hypothetical protein